MKRKHGPHQAAKARTPLRSQRRLWWVMAGIVVGVGGTAAALWRSADDEPRTALGVRVPRYLGTLVRQAEPTPPAAAASQRPATTTTRSD